jgi:hypothetical protein
MPKFDFYPSFNAGEVSPFIDARTSLEKYRSACRTLENFQILPYGGAIRRPGTEFRGATKSATTQTRLIGFNFSTTTRFVIEMGAGYMRFWSGETGAPVTVATPGAWATGNIYSVGNYVREDNVTYYCKTAHTSGTFDTDLDAGRWVAQTIFEIPTPYATATHLREIQFAQINDIMYFAHANYLPHKLSRLADNNWTFAPVVFDYPPLQDQNATEQVVNIYPNPDPWVAGTNYILGDYVKPPAWVASTTYAVGDIVLISSSSIAYECITANTDATFTAANWSAQNQANQSYYYYAMSAHRAGSNFGVDQAAGKWSQFPIPLNEMGKYSVSAGSSLFLSSTIGSQVELKWQKPNFYAEQLITGNNVSSTLAVEGGWDFSTSGTWTATMQILRVPSDVFSAGRIVATATRSGTVVSVYHPFHGWNDGDRICVGDGISTNNYATHGATINVTGTHTYTYPITGNTQTGYLDIYPENLTKMEIVREYSVSADRNIITSGTESTRCGLKIRILDWVSGSGSIVQKARLETDTKITGGIATIVGSGQINVDKWLGEGPRLQRNTKFWAFSSFSSTRGYPRSVAMHEQRLCFGGTSSQPNTIWCSQIDNFENFKTGATAADAVQFTLAASEGNRINWMYSQSQLLIGTSGDEWTIGSADSSASLSATNVQANRQSSYGSKYMKAALVNDVLLFVQRNGRKVRELVYELNKDGWVAPDLTLLAEHITNGEIVEIAYQQQPDAILWCVRGDGTLIAMTYERDQKVVGWHRHTLGDADVESVATIYGNGTEDEVWMVVKRYVGIVAGQRVQFTNLPAGSNISDTETYVVLANPGANTFTIGSLIGESLAIANSSITANTTQVVVVNGSCSAPISNLSNGVFTYTGTAAATIRTVERFPLLWRTHLDNQTANSWRYLDGWSKIDAGAAGRTISGLDRFNGKTVTVMQDGQAPVTRTVASGSITVPVAAGGYVGLPYTSTLRPMKLDADFEDGTAQSRKKRIHQVVVRTLKSRGGEVRTNNGTWYALAPTTTTGDQKIILGGAFGIDADVDVRQTEPYPMCIISILPKWDAYGNE